MTQDHDPTVEHGRRLLEVIAFAAAVGAGLVSDLLFVAAYRMFSRTLAAADVMSSAAARVALGRVMRGPEVAPSATRTALSGPLLLAASRPWPS